MLKKLIKNLLIKSFIVINSKIGNEIETEINQSIEI